MKRFNLLKLSVTSILALGALFAGCNTEDVDFPQARFGVSQTSFRFDSGEGSDKLLIETNRDWKITFETTQPDWIGINKLRGSGTTEVTMNYTANEGVRRETLLKVSTSTLYEYVRIVQNGESEAGVVIYTENFGTSVDRVDDRWPYVDAFDGWQRGGDIDQSQVQYEGYSATIANSGAKYVPDAVGYSGAPYLYMAAATAYFQANNINVSGYTDFTLKFGALFQENYVNDQPVFAQITSQSFVLSASLDGVTWTNLPLTIDESVKWTWITTQFSVPSETSTINLRIGNVTAGNNYQYRFDDLVLESGGGGTVIGGGGGGTGEEVPISQIRALASNVPNHGDSYAIPEGWSVAGTVVTDHNSNQQQTYQFAIQDGTTAGSGIMVNLQESGASHTFARGDKVSIDLTGADINNYNGLLQLRVPQASITRTSTGTAPDPVVVSQNELNDYQSMYVAIENAEIIDDFGNSQLAPDSKNTSYQVEVDGQDGSFTLYVRGAASFAGQAVPMGSGTIKGVAGYFNEVQLIPVDYDDLSGLTGPRFGVFTVSAPRLSGSLKLQTASTAKVLIDYKNSEGNEAYNYSASISGAGATGLSITSTQSGTFARGSGTIEFSITGTPTQEGAVTITITGTPEGGAGTINTNVSEESVIIETSLEGDPMPSSATLSSDERVLTFSNGMIVEMVQTNAKFEFTPGNASIRTSMWDQSDAAWIITVPANEEIYGLIELASRTFGSNKGPSDWKITWSSDKSNWQDAASGDDTYQIPSSGGNASGIMNITPKVNIPESAKIPAGGRLYLRLTPTSNNSIDGTGLQSGGMNRLAEYINVSKLQ